MKAEFIKIAQDLEQGKIDEPKAQALLLGLFDVSDMLPDLETVRESGQKYANEKGGSDYGFAFRCYTAGINWTLNYITQKLKGNYR